MPRIRAITISIRLKSSDFNDVNALYERFLSAKHHICTLKDKYINEKYEVQTLRIAFNSFEDWLIDPSTASPVDTVSDIALSDESRARLQAIDQLLQRIDVEFCSLGQCMSINYMSMIPDILAVSQRFYCSVHIDRPTDSTGRNIVHPDYRKCRKAAEVVLNLVTKTNELGNFNYCCTFNCPSGVPFFPAAYASSSSSADNCESEVTIALESGDLLFLAFYGCDDINEAGRNLKETLLQILQPIDKIAKDACNSLCKVRYNGIDASINPGLALPDSVGNGIESLLSLYRDCSTEPNSTISKHFGSFGTLSVVSVITGAIKELQQSASAQDISIIGYSGLMLPVMEDIILAERAAQATPAFTLRDLLAFSSVCGVGLDTVPVPGDISIDTVACIYMETAALAFRLNKPLSVRLLPMPGKSAGELTDIVSPYLCNTKVFHV